MCGIFGRITKSNQGSETPCAAALRLMAHRGPDGEGSWSGDGGRIWLGHRRLAIIDLSERAAQPMADGSGRCVITFNGEIYNYLELRRELASRGARFRSDSDTEVILEAYKQWGEACLDRFNGMFAFALYDRATGTLFCARDRFGEKPLLFATGEDFFAFASEYKALLQLPQVPRDHDEFRLLRGLHNASTGLDADRNTVFRAIQQLLPAEKLTLDVHTLDYRIARYWDVRIDPDLARLTEQEAFARFRELLTDSVRIRMRSDVPVGSCLSGGLDSSAIVSLVRKVIQPDGEYHTFTGRFPGTTADEWEYAREVIAQTGVTPHVVEPTAARFAEELPDFIWYNELPVGSSSQYAQWCVFRLAREHGVTVLLDGQGADEMLGGYEQYFQYYVESLKEAGQFARLDAELEAIRRRYPLALVSTYRSLRERLPLRLRHAVANLTGTGTNLLYGLKPEVANQVRASDRASRDQRFHPLAGALYQDTFGKYLTTLLRYGDRNSMAHSREVRLPFCDHRIAELVFSLPPWLLMGQVQTKRMLREGLNGVLPEKIRTRWNKQGFRPPQERWFQGPLLETARAIIESRRFAQSGIWYVPWWRKVLKRIANGEGHLAWSLWQPLMYESWRTHFVNRLVCQGR